MITTREILWPSCRERIYIVLQFSKECHRTRLCKCVYNRLDCTVDKKLGAVARVVPETVTCILSKENVPVYSHQGKVTLCVSSLLS